MNPKLRPLWWSTESETSSQLPVNFFNSFKNIFLHIDPVENLFYFCTSARLGGTLVELQGTGSLGVLHVHVNWGLPRWSIGRQWWWHLACLIGRHLCWCHCVYKSSRVPPSYSSLTHSLFFFNTKLSITKDTTSLDLIFLRFSVLYLFVNRFTKIYSYVFYIDLWLVLIITGRVYSNIFFILNMR
jgi:hypothetical protein